MAEQGVGWQCWALSLQSDLGRWHRGDMPVQQSGHAGWPSLFRGDRGAEPRSTRRKAPPPACLTFSPSSLQGFEPRDTDIGRKLVVWRALQARTGPRKLLSLSPDLDLNR